MIIYTDPYSYELVSKTLSASVIATHCGGAALRLTTCLVRGSFGSNPLLADTSPHADHHLAVFPDHSMVFCPAFW